MASVVASSLLPETDRKIPRTQVNIKEVNDGIQLEIQAQDTSALRAAINSYLRWIKVSMNTYEETHG
ncbi:MAG: hypothetical protein JSW00_12660 [Thermoplasmata archaeon]|nr:MAG: hypothetical protein JSW00_12660 [Thermoplasmata archaeon]